MVPDRSFQGLPCCIRSKNRPQIKERSREVNLLEDRVVHPFQKALSPLFARCDMEFGLGVPVPGWKVSALFDTGDNAPSDLEAAIVVRDQNEFGPLPGKSFTAAGCTAEAPATLDTFRCDDRDNSPDDCSIHGRHKPCQPADCFRIVQIAKRKAPGALIQFAKSTRVCRVSNLAKNLGGPVSESLSQFRKGHNGDRRAA